MVRGGNSDITMYPCAGSIRRKKDIVSLIGRMGIASMPNGLVSFLLNARKSDSMIIPGKIITDKKFARVLCVFVKKRRPAKKNNVRAMIV